MGKFIIFTFLMLGWTFYELSGGSEFEPESRILAEAQPTEEIAPTETGVEVTRTATTQLVSLTLPVTQDAPAATITQASVTQPAEVEAPAEETVAAVVEEIVEATPEPVVEEAPLDLRAVAGSWVNMRSGPGTNFDVLDTLPGGTEAEVMEVNASGWARIRILSTGEEGWMAERLLDAS